MCWPLDPRIAFAAFFAITSLSFSIPAQSYEAEMRALAEKLAARLELTNQKTGSVLDFTNLDGTPTTLGRFLAQELSDQLIAVSKKIKLVDRANLQHLLRENKLTESGLLDRTTSKKLGNLAGIDTFLIGTSVVFGNTIRLNVRAISTETQIIVASQATTIPTSGLETFIRSNIENGNVTSIELVTECDRLAANPNDLKRPKDISGVEFSDIDPSRAGPACDDAMQQYAAATRFVYQAGRVADARKDYARAQQLYGQAAESGYSAAMSSLGLLYVKGTGVRQDYDEARRWFERGAALGDRSATGRLGVLYFNGWGVPKDLAEARRLYEKAAALGDAASIRNIGSLYASGNGVAKNYVEARRWWEKAAALGDASAMGNLGVLYVSGLGVRQDYAEGRRWYEKAIELGDAAAMGNLGVLYGNGWGVRQDHNEAVRWFERAAALGDIKSMMNIGKSKAAVAGPRQDYADARRWFEKAAGLGSADAMTNLGIFYAHGLGVRQDEAEALRWLEKAAALNGTNARQALNGMQFWIFPERMLK